MSATRVYRPDRTIHTVATLGAPVALCGRSVVGFAPLPADPWARVGAEAGTRGACLHCAREVAP